jgi:LPS-assembly protein
MNPRTRLIITVLTLCHLLLLVPVVTCQLPSQIPQETATSETPRLLPSEEVTIKAYKQGKDHDTYTLQGDAEITFRTYTLRADEITYNEKTGEVNGKGGVVFEGGPHDAHIQAKSATYNINTENGTFNEVIGSVGTRFRGKNVVLTSSSPFLFTGQEVKKIGRDRFIVLHGTVTSCELPTPKWTFNAEKVDVVAGEDAKIYHSTFRILKVPVFYFPYASHPVDTLGRASGFLLPSVGQSSRKGFSIGESVYWAINRSMDTTVGAEYYSRRGWSQAAEFRARPSQDSHLNIRYTGMLDRGDPVTGQNQGGEEAHLDSELILPYGFRGVADLNYLSSFLYRLAFSNTYSQAVNSEVSSVAFAAKNFNGYSFDVMASRYQNFQSTNPGDRILLVHAPTVEFSSVERHVGETPAVWAFDVSGEGVSRRQPNFVSSTLVGRFDVRPRVALPLTLSGWTLRPEVALRDTYYSDSQTYNSATGVATPIDDALNRRALEGTVELRPPSLSRIFDQEVRGRKLKHVIEPRVTYQYTTGINNFRNIIRFDGRDILSDTNEVEFGLVQRLYGKRVVGKRNPNCEPAQTSTELKVTPGTYLPGTSAEALHCEDEGTSTRELVTWEVKQKYFANDNFGGAIVNGTRNVLTTTADFAGIAFLTEPRKWSPIVSKIRVATSTNTDIQWEIDYDLRKGYINSSTAFVDYRIGEVFIGGSQAMLRAPGNFVVSTTSGQLVPVPNLFNQYRLLLGYGHPGKRGISAGGSLGYDVAQNFLQYGAVQTSYNWDCCGVSIEYRRFALGSVRNENQFRFAFTLANVGTFGNLRRQERLF